MTADVDVAVFLNQEHVPMLIEAFASCDYYVPPAEVITLELKRQQRGHFNILHSTTGMKADIYPSRNHPLYTWAWGRRQRGKCFSGEAWFAPPEYVILWKLEFYREGGSDKHLRDIAGILMIQKDNLAWETLNKEVQAIGLVDCWIEAQQRMG